MTFNIEISSVINGIGLGNRNTNKGDNIKFRNFYKKMYNFKAIF